MSNYPKPPERRPPLLPEQPNSQKSSKRGTAPVRNPRRWIERALWAVALLLIGLLGLVVYLVMYQPDTLGLQGFSDATQTADTFDLTGVALGGTAIAISDREFDIGNTAAALDARSTLVDQRETQSAQDFIATETSIAVSNAQQGTAAALEYQSTQVAFAQEATRVELNYRGTQAALNRDATAIALGFATQSAPGQLNTTDTPPTLEGRPLFEENFAIGLSGTQWRFGEAADWTLTGDGSIRANRSGAWLLTQINTFSDYTFTVEISPLPDVFADYYVLVNVPTERDGLTLRLTYNGARLTTSGLYRFNPTQLIAGDGLLGEVLVPVQAVQLPNTPPQSTLTIVVTVRGTDFNASSGDVLLLTATLDAPLPGGAVGVQLPAGAGLTRVVVTD